MTTYESGEKGFLFTVEILVEATTNGNAVESLLNSLNQNPNVKDYSIKKGIELGKLIEAAKASTGTTAAPAQAESRKKESAKAAEPKNEDQSIVAQVNRYKDKNTLVRLTALKGKGVKLSIPCRILNFDPSTQIVTVYHVDEKKVYPFKITEIEDLTT